MSSSASLWSKQKCRLRWPFPVLPMVARYLNAGTGETSHEHLQECAHTGTIFIVSGESPLVGSFYGHCSFCTLIMNFSVCTASKLATHCSPTTCLFYFGAILAHPCLCSTVHLHQLFLLPSPKVASYHIFVVMFSLEDSQLYYFSY